MSEESEMNEIPLGPIVGEQLTAVTFIHDYLQLQFDATLAMTLLVFPVLNVGDNRLSIGEPGYRDALCERIEKTVTHAYVRENEEMRIAFSDASSISVSLREADRIGPETVLFHNGPKLWVW
jgi:hypothetical protein